MISVVIILAMLSPGCQVAATDPQRVRLDLEVLGYYRYAINK
jgi:hypothetical protein